MTVASRTDTAAPAAPEDTVHLIAKDEEVVIEHHPEDWIAILLFWSLAFIVFLQFFTRYVLNDSLAWTEEIARYGLMWVVFVGGAVVTRKNTHIAVELLSNLMRPGPARSALLALIDFVKLAFLVHALGQGMVAADLPELAAAEEVAAAVAGVDDEQPPACLFLGDDRRAHALPAHDRVRAADEPRL